MTQKLKNGEKKGNPTNNGLKTLIEEKKPDFLALQEVKTQNQSDLDTFKTDFKYIFTNLSKYKKGYSGVALLTNKKPQWISYGFEMYSEEEIGNYSEFEFTDEGRIITAKYPQYIVITVYVPNAQPELARLADRLEWESLMRKYLKKLEEDMKVPIILCGDLNIAPNEIDIHNPKGKSKTAGFSTEERREFQKLLETGFTDSFRHLYPTTIKYSYWSNFANARGKDIGWRIDMVMVSNVAQNKIRETEYLKDFMGSDHCAVLCDLDI